MTVPQLLIDIARCKDFCSLIKQCQVHNCSTIVGLQKDKGVDFQQPEPWSGDIVNAPLLFISSNPSYSEIELYPTQNWPDEMIADFFINRFKDRCKKYSWVFGNKTLLINSQRSNFIRYWSSIHNRAIELFGRDDIKQGIDYCITEIVHCKSQKESGVKKALPACASNYLEKKLVISGAQIIVVIGSIARDYFKNHKKEKTFVKDKIEYFNNINKNIPIIFLPHPNARTVKTFEQLLKNKTFDKATLDEYKKKLNTTSNNNLKIDDISNIQLPSEDEVEAFIKSQIKSLR